MTDTLYPLKLTPKPSERLWGGHKLASFVPGLQTQGFSEPIGEAWLVYAENVVENGAFAGQTLQQLADTFGAQLVGTKSAERYGNKVPLLAKFIDAAQDLSIQVHPDDTYALTHEASSGHLGKSEAWLVLAAEPNASIIWGFKDDLTDNDIRDAITAGTLETHLNTVPVKAGDVIYNPAGTVHAIGAGLLIFEIQQSSDLTYRLYDFNRKDSKGNLRELHVDKGLTVADKNVGEHALITPVPLNDHTTELIRTEHFVMQRLNINTPENSSTNAASMEIITVIAGEVTLDAADARVHLGQGESVVLAATQGEYTLFGEGTVLRCFVPDA